MTTELIPNKIGWFKGLVAIIIALSFICFLVYLMAKPIGKFNGLNKSGYFYWIIIIALLWVVMQWGRRIYMMPIGAILDNSLKTINIKYLFKKKRSIGRDEMANYSFTNIKFRNSSYQGLYLYLSDGAKILFSDLNFSDYSPIETFLNDNKVERVTD